MLNLDSSDDNPYLQGEHKAVQAKKGDPAMLKIRHWTIDH